MSSFGRSRCVLHGGYQLLVIILALLRQTGLAMDVSSIPWGGRGVPTSHQDSQRGHDIIPLITCRSSRGKLETYISPLHNARTRRIQYVCILLEPPFLVPRVRNIPFSELPAALSFPDSMSCYPGAKRQGPAAAVVRLVVWGMTVFCSQVNGEVQRTRGGAGAWRRGRYDFARCSAVFVGEGIDSRKEKMPTVRARNQLSRALSLIPIHA